ncbi:MAG TPA: helix-hairpin-helix domain-containing protein [Cellvibrionaceae bacterium]
MNPAKVIRERVSTLTDLPNIGKAMQADLNLLGIARPQDLIGRCPYEMYEELCDITGANHDPCVIDVFISVASFINGGEARPWWKFTAERKRALAKKSNRSL